MKHFLTVLLLFIATCCYSQSDSNGNPVFNSITTQTESINDFHLLSNYYTLKGNIENKRSSVYMADTPTLDQVEKAAVTLPSDFFIIEKSGAVINLILVRNAPQRDFFVVNPESQQRSVFPCTLEGDITENRANEIVKENYDPAAKIANGKLYFNNKQFKIISNTAIKNAVLKLIDQKKLSAGSSNMKVLSQEEIKAKILKESAEGGKLDFFTPIKGHEYDAYAVKPGLIATNIEIALYKWGRAAFDLGVNRVEDALAIWAQLKNRPPNSREEHMITQGFNRELEK